MTHSCLLIIIDHTVREVFVLEVKVGLSGQIICIIMRGQGVSSVRVQHKREEDLFCMYSVIFLVLVHWQKETKVVET